MNFLKSTFEYRYGVFVKYDKTVLLHKIAPGPNATDSRWMDAEAEKKER